METNNEGLVIYTYENDYAKLPNGMYIGLFHGTEGDKKRPKTEDWGFEGPVIGPLVYVHSTYGSDVKFKFRYFEDTNKAHQTCGFDDYEESVNLVDGCFPCLGNLYGDWTVFYIENGMFVEN